MALVRRVGPPRHVAESHTHTPDQPPRRTCPPLFTATADGYPLANTPNHPSPSHFQIPADTKSWGVEEYIHASKLSFSRADPSSSPARFPPPVRFRLRLRVSEMADS